jgi:hypothetical protein
MERQALLIALNPDLPFTRQVSTHTQALLYDSKADGAGKHPGVIFPRRHRPLLRK